MKEQTIQMLKDNPVFWSRLGFCYDPPLQNDKGEPLVFVDDLGHYGKDHRMFTKAGVKIHTSILHSGWVGVNEYDYSLTDRVLEEVFRDNPDIYYIPRVKLNVPIDWCYENPEEVFVYDQNINTVEEIRSLVGTLQQDYIGYEAPNGYYTASAYVDKRPNVGGLIARQSFSSEKWLRDAGDALERLMNRLDQSPYGDRILGYHIAYGASGESVLWGRSSRRYGDYGITHKKAFYRWGLQKYHTREALGEAWMQPDIREDHVLLPTPEQRYGRTEKVDVFFRQSKEQQICTDFDEFISKVNADAIEYFAKIVKKKSPELLVGVFYGYFLHVDNSAYTGHLAMEQLLNSPYVDFFAAPKSYYRCKAGEPGGCLCPTQSVNHRKLWVDELDNRTHLAKVVEPAAQSHGFRDTQAVLWREFAKNLSADAGFWWMDLGGGWFADEEIMGEITKMVQTNNLLRSKPHKSESDILVLVDENCITHMNISTDVRLGFMEDFLCEMHMTGCLSDVYRLMDLEWLDLTQYKLIVFAYTFQITDRQREMINAIPKDKVLMFQYAAGIIGEKGVSLANVEKLTGLFLQETERGQLNCPELVICDEQKMDRMMTDTKGRTKMAACTRKNGGKNIVNTGAYLKHTVLRQIAESAGCHCYTPAGNIVYGDNRFLGVFSTERVDIQVQLKTKGDYRNVITEEVFEQTDSICMKLEEKSAAFLTAVD